MEKYGSLLYERGKYIDIYFFKKEEKSIDRNQYQNEIGAESKFRSPCQVLMTNICLIPLQCYICASSYKLK